MTRVRLFCLRETAPPPIFRRIHLRWLCDDCAAPGSSSNVYSWPVGHAVSERQAQSARPGGRHCESCGGLR